MRFSLNKDDPGYGNYMLLHDCGLTVMVKIDGEYEKDCIMADDCEGVAQVVLRDAEGMIVENGGIVQTAERRGQVVLEIRRFP